VKASRETETLCLEKKKSEESLWEWVRVEFLQKTLVNRVSDLKCRNAVVQG